MTGPTADDQHDSSMPASRRRRRRVLIGTSVLLTVVPLGLTVAPLAAGRTVPPFVALVWAMSIGVIALGWWGFRREQRLLRTDRRAVARRQLDKRAQRVYVFGAPVAYLVASIVTRSLGLEGPERWGALVVLLVLAWIPLHLLAKRFDPRARLWGAPRPLSDDELAARDEAERSTPASVTKPW